MSKTKKILGATFVAVVMWVVASSVQTAQAIPYFARKHEADCSMCHWQQPKLNSFGKKFQENGYRITKNEAPDSSFKSIGNMPLSLKMEPRFSTKNAASASSDFQLHSIELQIAGSLPDGGTVMVEKYLEERGDYHNAGDAFITWPLSDKGTLKIGQFKTMSHIPDSERLTLSRNMVYNTRSSIGGSTNRVRLRDAQRGLEFGYRLAPDTDITASIFNGNGTPAESGNISDNNDTKSFNLELVRGFTRSSLGAFFYGGDSADASSQKNRFYRTGLTAIYKPTYYWNVEIIGMLGKDRNLLGDGATRATTRAFSAEVDHMLREGLVAFLRHGQHRVTAPGQAAATTRETLLGFSMMLNSTQKITLEYQTLSGQDNDGLEMELELNF